MNPVSHGGEAGFFHFWRLEVEEPNEAGRKKKCLILSAEGLPSTCHIRHFKASEALIVDSPQLPVADQSFG